MQNHKKTVMPDQVSDDQYGQIYKLDYSDCHRKRGYNFLVLDLKLDTGTANQCNVSSLEEMLQGQISF